jgi:hypothetical protein
MTRGSNSAYQGIRSSSSVARKGGRRPREAEEEESIDLTDEDRDKRQKRRQRNKEAAARCRKRRLDLMNTLSEQVDMLKDENRKKQSQIEQLLQQKNKLVELMQSHDCHIPKDLLTTNISTENSSISGLGGYGDPSMFSQQMPPIKRSPPSVIDTGEDDSENGNSDGSPIDMYKDDYMSPPMTTVSMQIPSSYQSSTTCSMIINNDPVISQAALGPPTKRPKMEDDSMEENNHVRPTTLPIEFSSRPNGLLSNNLPSINTPSNGFPQAASGNDYVLLHQNTGLTPVVTGPIFVPHTAAPPQHSELRQL